jgi:hypothetical protein
MCKRFWWKNPKERGHSEDRGVDGRRGNRMDLRKTGWGCGLDSVGSGQKPVAGC